MLDQLGKRIGAPPTRTASSVFSGWREVVGDAVADHANPVALRDRVLVVEVDHPTWATQVKLLAGDLLERLAEVAGDGVVGRIEVRVSAPPKDRN